MSRWKFMSHVGPYCHSLGPATFLFPLGFNPGLVQYLAPLDLKLKIYLLISWVSCFTHACAVSHKLCM